MYKRYVIVTNYKVKLFENDYIDVVRIVALLFTCRHIYFIGEDVKKSMVVFAVSNFPLPFYSATQSI
jgi:hypothetical protein